MSEPPKGVLTIGHPPIAARFTAAAEAAAVEPRNRGDKRIMTRDELLSQATRSRATCLDRGRRNHDAECKLCAMCTAIVELCAEVDRLAEIVSHGSGPYR